MQQTFTYDHLGNTTNTGDDSNVGFDRSLGTVTNGRIDATGAHKSPNRIEQAPGLNAIYDAAGNLASLDVERTPCPSTAPNCTHRFRYDWDEVGQLTRARRWDYPAGPLPIWMGGSSEPPTPPPPAAGDAAIWDIAYLYSMGARALTTTKDDLGVRRHTLEIFSSMRVNRAVFDLAQDDYARERYNEVGYVGGTARVFYDADQVFPAPDQTTSTSS